AGAACGLSLRLRTITCIAKDVDSAVRLRRNLPRSGTRRMVRDLGTLILGRREWVALPELGLSAVKAKVDTGAKTSALHAENIQILGPAGKVRFVVHPLLDEPELTVACEADLFDLREVT